MGRMEVDTQSFRFLINCSYGPVRMRVRVDRSFISRLLYKQHIMIIIILFGMFSLSVIEPILRLKSSLNWIKQRPSHTLHNCFVVSVGPSKHHVDDIFVHMFMFRSNLI